MPTHPKPALKAEPEPRGVTPLRKVRIEPELWEEASRLTDLAGTTCSKVMRDALAAWVRRNRKRLTVDSDTTST